MLSRLPRSLIALSVVVYLTSFLTPVGNGVGAQLFWYGLLYCWYLPLSFAWWANVLLWFAYGEAGRGRWGRAAAWAVPATVLATSWLLMGDGSPAFWAWVASMAVMAGAGLSGWLLARVRAVDSAEDEPG